MTLPMVELETIAGSSTDTAYSCVCSQGWLKLVRRLYSDPQHRSGWCECLVCLPVRLRLRRAARVRRCGLLKPSVGLEPTTVGAMRLVRSGSET